MKKHNRFSIRFSLPVFLLLLLLPLCLILTSCGGKDKNGAEEQTTEEALADDYLDTALPAADYDGADYGIIGSTHTQIDPGEEENAEPIHDAQLRRNLKIAERYDVNFVYHEVSRYEVVCESVESAVLANEKLYSIIFGIFSGCGTYMVNNGLIMSSENLPYVDLSQKWWAQDCTDQLTIGDKTVFLAGMIAYEHCIDGSCLFFNKKLASDKALDDHFEDVRSYRWTLDKMYKNAKTVAHDDNGDTMMDASDTWGLIFDGDMGHALMASCEIRAIDFDEDHIPVVIQTPDTDTFSKVDTIHSILTNHRYCVSPSDEEDENLRAADKSFEKGKALYTQGRCQDGAGYYRPADFYDFGIIPDPMWNESQQAYHSWAYSWDGGGIYFPICCPDEEMTGVVTEALAYQSSVEGGFYYAIIEKYIKGKGTYDYDSEEMVDLILSSKRYDLSNLFWWGISDIINKCCIGRDGDKPLTASLSSLWAGRANASKTACRSTVRTWNRLD